jgi:peptide/nickel transport system substrate-binding protein
VLRRLALPLLVAGLAATTITSGALAQEDDDVVVRIGLHAAEKNLNPFISPQALPITHDFTMLVYDTLFWSQARTDPEPWLATGAEPSDDLRTWTVSLRDGVKWHDGEAFTADDVAFTFQAMVDAGGVGRYGHHLTDHPTFLSANVIDDLTVELNFADPIATFKLVPGGDMPIIPEHIWAGIEDPTADATSLPIGTGPFRMTEYNPDVSYRLEANEDYFLGKPTVDTLIMPVVADAQAAFAGLQTGELDFVTRNLPAPLVEQVAGNAELSLLDGSRLQSTYLMFNTRKPVLNDPVVRKAMSMALDLQTIVDIVEGGLGRPGNDTWTHPDSPWANPTGGHEFDLAAAGTMLDDAGYTVGDGGTRIGPDGAPLAFTLLVNATAPPQIRSGELVAEQLAELGVDITVEPLDGPALAAQRRGSPDAPAQVEMFIAVFEAHAHADPDHLFFFFHSPNRGVGGFFSGYSNPEFDAITEDALDEDVEAKLPLVHQAQEILANEVPAITLYYPDGRWAYRPAAYDGWISDPGHGAFTKRSFLADYANVAVEPEPEPAVVADPEPDASADTVADVAEEAGTEPDETDPAVTEAPADDSTPVDEAVADEGEDDDGLGAGGILAIVVLAIAAIGGLGYVGMRKRKNAGTVED